MSFQGPPQWGPSYPPAPPQSWAPTYPPQQQAPQWQTRPPPKQGLPGWVIGVLLALVAAGVVGGVVYWSRFDHGTAEDAITAFRRGGLEVGDVSESTRGFLDNTPQTERDGRSFDTPSVGLFARGRVWSFVNEQALETKRSAIEATQGHRIIRRHNLLLELDGRMSQTQADRYRDALEGM